MRHALSSGLAVAALTLLAATPFGSAAGQTTGADKALPPDSPVLRTESFEADMPAYVTCDQGTLSISDLRAQDGSHSLRWDWVPGSALCFNTGPLGNVNVWTGYGGYSRSAFSIRIYNDTASDAALTFAWKSGDRVGASFEFPLVMRGWQHVCYHYSHNSQLKARNPNVLAATDRIVVTAPLAGAGGTVYLDMINFNQPVDFRGGRLPVTQLWTPLEPATAGVDPELLAPPTPAELDGAAALAAALSGQPRRALTDADLAAMEKRLTEFYSLRRLDDRTVVGRTLGTDTGKVADDLLALARLWVDADQPDEAPLRTRVEAHYLLLDDYFRELGAVAQGSIGGLSWYGGRSHGDAGFLMRDVLRRHNRLERVRDCLKYNWGYDKVFTLPTARQRMEMDYFYIDTRYLLNIALMHDTPAEVVTHLRAFARRFDVDVSNQIEPDGSLYHHGAYNFSYVCYEFPVLAQQIRLLSTTPFAVSLQTFEKVKTAGLAMRWFCNLTEAPIFMHGRHPGRMGLNPTQYLSLAEAGRACNAGKLDRDLARAYLRFLPADAGKAEFLSEGITPEPAPQGNVALNYAGLMGHRRGEWLAVVRGYGKYYWAQESYANANRHGLFLGNGYLDILASGSPINVVDSGCDVAHGWDWRHLDGTTVYIAPLAKIANGHGTMSERSDIGFIGGLSHAGRNGVFVMPLHSRFQYTKSLPDGQAAAPDRFFAANKSYFFFDDRIACLGSDIELPDSPFHVRTILFQKRLKTPATPIQIDAQEVTALPFAVTLAPDRPHTLLDTQCTGYYIPAGQSVTVVREHQTSRDGHDRNDTAGDAATAWFDHGANPTEARYAYVVLPDTSQPELEAFAAAMAGADGQAPIQVWRQDSQAHIVLDRHTRNWGCVFYAAQELPRPEPERHSLWKRLRGLLSGAAAPQRLPILAVSQPCLVMLEQTGADTLLVSIGDPDIRADKGPGAASTVRVTLDGAWRLAEAVPHCQAELTGDGSTVLTVTCTEGKSYTMNLAR